MRECRFPIGHAGWTSCVTHAGEPTLCTHAAAELKRRVEAQAVSIRTYQQALRKYEPILYETQPPTEVEPGVMVVEYESAGQRIADLESRLAQAAEEKQNWIDITSVAEEALAQTKADLEFARVQLKDTIAWWKQAEAAAKAMRETWTTKARPLLMADYKDAKDLEAFIGDAAREMDKVLSPDAGRRLLDEVEKLREVARLAAHFIECSEHSRDCSCGSNEADFDDTYAKLRDALAALGREPGKGE